MLSFLNSAKNEISLAYFVFTNFTLEQLKINYMIYQQVYCLLNFLTYINIIINIFNPCPKTIQRNRLSEESKSLGNHPNC